MAGPQLEIAFATSEVVPFVKTGGLADVSAALPKALGRLGHKVTIFVPRYGTIPFPPGRFVGAVHVPVDPINRSAGFYEATLGGGVRVIFVEHPPFFDRGGPYGDSGGDYPDNRLRFGFFSRAVLEFFRSRGERPDVFHAHDWQTGLLPVYLKTFYADDPTLGRLPTLFTVHNLAYQGNFGLDTLSALGLPSHLASREGLEFHGGLSYLKGGILFSEMVNTVSPTYAQEIQTPEMGYGFDGILASRAADLSGILNGVDYDEWDPRHDPHIASPYSPEDLSGKALCRSDLLQAFSLPEYPDLPIVGVTSRLVYQKGFDIVVGAWYDWIHRPLRMVVLGTGERDVQDGFEAMARRAPDRFAVRFTYDSALAHKVEAGSDMFLMPSRYEPCGLAQMYSLRYGAVPVVRATGGLVDTVEPFPGKRATGFLWTHADGTGMMWAVDRALAAFEDKPGWERLIRNGMARDFGWARSARSYVELYRRAIEKA
jgi:starch synthase